MAALSLDEVHALAVLARLGLSDDEARRYAEDLGAVLGYVKTLEEVDVEGVLPMTHAVASDCPVRADQPEPPLPLDVALANAPKREASFFQVPRMIPGAEGGSAGDEEP